MRTGALGGTLQVLNNHIIRSVTVTMDTAGCQQSSREARRESGFRQCSFQSSHNPGESNRRTIIVRTWGWDSSAPAGDLEPLQISLRASARGSAAPGT